MRLNAAFRVAKNTVALSAARTSVPLFSFVFVVYAARLMGVDGFGKYVLVQTYFQLFLALCATGLSIVVTREIAKRRSLVNQYLSASVLLVSVLALASNGLLTILSHVFRYAPDTQAAVYFAGLALFPATVSVIFEAAFVGFEKAEYVTYGTVIENTLRITVSIFALYKGYGLLALFVILLGTRTFMLLFYLCFLKRSVAKVKWYCDWALLKEIVRDWKVFALENWLSNVFHRIDILFLSFFHGELAVGIYAAAYKILNPINVLATSFTSAMFPYLSRLFEESKDTFRRLSEEVLKYMVVVVLFITVSTAVLADWLIVLIYTDVYADSVAILRVLVWILIPVSLNPFLSHILFARHEQRKCLQVGAMSLSFYVAIAFWLIPRWGGVGAAWALLFAVSAAMCLYFVFVFKGKGGVRTLLTFGRAGLAGLGVGILILVSKGVHLLLVLSLAMVLYVLLLIIFRVPSSSDVELFRRVTVRGLQRASRIVGRA